MRHSHQHKRQQIHRLIFKVYSEQFLEGRPYDRDAIGTRINEI